MDAGFGLLDISLASYNQFVLEDLPNMVNGLRPIVWSERGLQGAFLSTACYCHRDTARPR